MLESKENTVGKGEIACYEQFLLCPQCFQKACFPGVSKGVIVWEWVKKHCGKTRKCWKTQFSPPSLFSTLPKTNLNAWVEFNLSS